MTAAEAEVEARRLSEEDAATPFALERGPLFRARLLRLGEDDHLVLVNMHHIVSDGWSMGILRRELQVLYQAFLEPGAAAPLVEPPLQYADFAIWQRGWLQGEALRSQLDYWVGELEDGPRSLDLPTRGARPATQTISGDRLRLCLDPELTGAVRSLARQTRGTLFLVLEAVFAELLGRCSGAREVHVGTPVANRRYAELESLIGFFVNTLVLRNRLDAGATVRRRIAEVRECALDAFAHQDLPFEKLVEALNPVRDPSRSPIFQVMFALQRVPKDDFELPGLTVTPWRQESVAARFDLTLSLIEFEDEISGELVYNTDLFDRDLIERLSASYVQLLRGFAEWPEKKPHQLSILTAAQEREVLVAFNEVAETLEPAEPVHRLVHEQALQRPDAIAVASSRETLTYGELDRRSDRMARDLLRPGVARWEGPAGPEVCRGVSAAFAESDRGPPGDLEERGGLSSPRSGISRGAPEIHVGRQRLHQGADDLRARRALSPRACRLPANPAR